MAVLLNHLYYALGTSDMIVFGLNTLRSLQCNVLWPCHSPRKHSINVGSTSINFIPATSVGPSQTGSSVGMEAAFIHGHMRIQHRESSHVRGLLANVSVVKGMSKRSGTLLILLLLRVSVANLSISDMLGSIVRLLKCRCSDLTSVRPMAFSNGNVCIPQFCIYIVWSKGTFGERWGKIGSTTYANQISSRLCGNRSGWNVLK